MGPQQTLFVPAPLLRRGKNEARKATRRVDLAVARHPSTSIDGVSFGLASGVNKDIGEPPFVLFSFLGGSFQNQPTQQHGVILIYLWPLGSLVCLHCGFGFGYGMIQGFECSLKADQESLVIQTNLILLGGFHRVDPRC